MSHFPTHGKIRNPVNARVPAYPVPCWPRNPAPRSRHRLPLEFLQQPPNADWRSGCELPIKRWVSIFPWRRAHCRCVTLSKIKCGDPDLSITVLKQGQSCLFSIQYFWRPGVSPLNSAFPFKNQIFSRSFSHSGSSCTWWLKNTHSSGGVIRIQLLLGAHTAF